MTTCIRCGKPLTILANSLYGLDALKWKYARICQDCATPDEKHEINELIGQGIVDRK
jgi:hypothetical protein